MADGWPARYLSKVGGYALGVTIEPDDTVAGQDVAPDTKAGGPAVCPECGGTGNVGAERCTACAGTGDVEERVPGE